MRALEIEGVGAHAGIGPPSLLGEMTDWPMRLETFDIQSAKELEA